MLPAITMIAGLLLDVIRIYSIVLVIYILMSWVPSTRETKFGRFLGAIAEPYLGFFRRFIPPLGMIDFSPIVALLVLNYLVPRGVVEVYRLIYTSLS